MLCPEMALVIGEVHIGVGYNHGCMLYLLYVLYVLGFGLWALVKYYGMDMLIRLVSQTIIESLNNTFNTQLHDVCSFSSHECCPSPSKIHRDIIHILQSQT
jgi:hypothetical protein